MSNFVLNCTCSSIDALHFVNTNALDEIVIEEIELTTDGSDRCYDVYGKLNPSFTPDEEGERDGMVSIATFDSPADAVKFVTEIANAKLPDLNCCDFGYGWNRPTSPLFKALEENSIAIESNKKAR